MVLSNRPSQLPLFLSYLTESQTTPSGYVSITKALITSQSKTDIRYHWLGSRWTG